MNGRREEEYSEGGESKVTNDRQVNKRLKVNEQLEPIDLSSYLTVHLQ